MNVLIVVHNHHKSFVRVGGNFLFASSSAFGKLVKGISSHDSIMARFCKRAGRILKIWYTAIIAIIAII